MIRHYIIMSSSYTEGTRIALDIVEESKLNKESIAGILKEIKETCAKDVPLSTHFICTSSKDWSSVQQYDLFFEDVKCIPTVSAFAETIKKSRTLTGLDVAVYILSRIKCTHLSLEKLVYFSYADYLCETGKRLFEDQIYAFEHGPIVDSVYEAYKRGGSKRIVPPTVETDSPVTSTAEEMPSKSRILFAVDGLEKLRSIEQTINRYGNYAPWQLVSITHREGSPWSYVDSSREYQVIPDRLILKHHHVETEDI